MIPTQYNEDAKRRVIPLIPGAIYQLIPSMGGQYIVLTKVDRRYAYASGIENHTADIKVRRARFPEIVIKMVDGSATSDSALALTGEVGYIIMLGGERIALFE